ncbi:MAG: formimidoylglutamate deiminase [Rickettsiales bacterium]|nr:formimidoylglutamate deiminase [Rickettsiales bacterium]
MNQLFFTNLLLPEGWAENVLIETDNTGLITAVTANSGQPANGIDGHIGVAGMANLHSHAFQRAMAGLGEWASADRTDSFWTWREVMYRFVERLRPEDLQAIAAQLYVEMLEAGFTAVGEFHYLHHQTDGSAYENRTEMAQQVMNAAETTGIAQTLLPVFYAYSGFGGTPTQVAQKRFHNDPDAFLTLVETCRNALPNDRNTVGIAPHSLRAVTPETLNHVLNATPTGPVHIHIAEQVKEVDDCLSWSGARPVQWLYDHHAVDERWCLVHATHLDASELALMAKSKAVAGLCPITEANLGDGIFEGVDYAQVGGRWGIGSDSHIRIDLAEELRSYEYSQRLRDLGRNRLAGDNQATGRALFDAALTGGAQALGQAMGAIKVGNYCDIASLDENHPTLIGKRHDNWLNSWIFAGDKSCIRDVWVNGTKMVEQGRHKKREIISASFAKAMKHLTD